MFKRPWLTKPWIFRSLIILMGTAFGALAGAAAYAVSIITMPWLTQGQFDLIVPGFVLIGIACALYCLGLDISRGRGKSK